MSEANTTRVGYWTQNDADEGLARDVLQTLCHAYPGHEWWVDIMGGIIHIKNMKLAKLHGMALHYAKVLIDPETLRKAVVYSGGEFLERAGLTRGAATEQQVLHIEGVKDKHVAR